VPMGVAVFVRSLEDGRVGKVGLARLSGDLMLFITSIMFWSGSKGVGCFRVCARSVSTFKFLDFWNLDILGGVLCGFLGGDLRVASFVRIRDLAVEY
jgi:hypothetical protein